MGLILNKALNLTEAEIRHAMRHTKSNAAAARFLGCHLNTYRKYASQYIDEETGKSLYELHKNVEGFGISKGLSNPDNRAPGFQKTPLYEILEGKHPTYNRKRLEERLIEEGVLEECCNYCGFDEKRITDYKTPLVLVCKDGVENNYKLDNLEMVCYNCYFLNYKDILHGSRKRLRFRED